MMKYLSLGFFLIVTIALAGCGNTNNYYSEPETANEKAGCTTCTGNQAMGAAQANTQMSLVPAAMTMPQATQIVTSYEEVYATEYTPNGPVVKKQLIPIKSTVPLVAQPMLMNVPNAYGTPCATPVTSAPYIHPVPVVIGTPPAQPVVPAVNSPVAWFGPTAAPNYSTQTNWF